MKIPRKPKKERGAPEGRRAYRILPANIQSKEARATWVTIKLALGTENSHSRTLRGPFLVTLHKKYPPTITRKRIPTGRTEVKGSRSTSGIMIGSRRNTIPPRVTKPSQRVRLQKATTFVISSAESPQAE